MLLVPGNHPMTTHVIMSNKHNPPLNNNPPYIDIKNSINRRVLIRVLVLLIRVIVILVNTRITS